VLVGDAQIWLACGDLRNVIKTVNSLPPTYTGAIEILINDRNPPVIARNLMFLLILAEVADEDLAVDTVLHLWYSTFIPKEYTIQMLLLAPKLWSYLTDEETSGSPFPLGKTSTLRMDGMLEPLLDVLLHYLKPEGQSLTLEEAQAEYSRVKRFPTRLDYRDRLYAGLRPSHRLAFEEYRRFGLVLPFGAANNHFNTPNPTLFSEDGRWLQTDFADPLEGWR